VTTFAMTSPPEKQPQTTRQPRFAYLLMTHLECEQVEELTARILDLSSGVVVVHHDAASTGVPWDGNPPERVALVDRSKILWGDWSIVDATLRMLRKALVEFEADWFVVISGEHRPVLDLASWEAAASSSGFDAFVEAEPLPDAPHFGRRDFDTNRFLARSTHRWFTVPKPRLHLAHRGLCALFKLSRYVQPLLTLEYTDRRHAWFVGVPRSRGPVKGWTLYKGSQWIAFNRRAAEALFTVGPDVTNWFRRGHIQDEIYIQTVLNHRQDLAVDNRVVTFVPPFPEESWDGWMYLQEDQLPDVWRSGAAFARKVDPVGRRDVMALIDGELDRHRSTTGSSAP
jgi:hypothetical protein